MSGINTTQPLFYYKNNQNEILFYVYHISDKYVYWKRKVWDKKMHKTLYSSHKKTQGSFGPFRGTRVTLDKLLPIKEGDI